MKITKVAAIIVTWNKRKDVCAVIKDIESLDLQNISLDIFVVDNASQDGTQNYLELHYPHIKVLQTGKNLGGSGGFSQGMNFVSNLDYQYIWLLDNDVRLDPYALVPLVETLNRYAEVGLVGSQIRKLDNPDIIQEIGSYIHEPKAHLQTYFGNSPVQSSAEILNSKNYLTVDICAAASLLFRREIIHQIGVFENYFLHFDDVEWCLRAKQFGWVIAAHPASIIWHCSPDFKQRPWISYYDERNLLYCWHKHRPDLLLRRLRILFPKLVYYSLTGRHFWALIHLQAMTDFLNLIQGEMPNLLSSFTLGEILPHNGQVLIQDSIYQHICDFLDVKQEQKFTLWYPPNKYNKLWAWAYLSFISCFSKPVDLAIVSYWKPNFYYLHLSRKLYFFTGNGYVISQISFTQIILDSLGVVYGFLKIYLRMTHLLKKSDKSFNKLVISNLLHPFWVNKVKKLLLIISTIYS